MQVPGDPPMTESKARSYFRDILLGLEYCKYYSNNDNNLLNITRP